MAFFFPLVLVRDNEFESLSKELNHWPSFSDYFLDSLQNLRKKRIARSPSTHFFVCEKS